MIEECIRSCFFKFCAFFFFKNTFFKQFKLPLIPLSFRESALNQKDISLGFLSEVIATTLNLHLQEIGPRLL